MNESQDNTGPFVTAPDGRKVIPPKGMSERTAQKIAAKVTANSEARKWAEIRKRKSSDK